MLLLATLSSPLFVAGLLQQLLKHDNFVSVIMSNSGKGADSASPELFEGDHPLPLMLKKLLLSRDEILQVASAQCISAVLVHSPAKYAPAFIRADIPGNKKTPECAICYMPLKNHVSCPPIEYGELQKLVEGVLKRCNDLSPAPFNRRLMGHLGGRRQNKAISQQGQFLQSALECFRNACCWSKLGTLPLNLLHIGNEGLWVPRRMAQHKKKRMTSFSRQYACFFVLQKYSERAIRPSLMEVFISTLSILFSIMPHICKKFSIKLATSCFIRLNLELKAKFCTGQSNPALNQACSSFLHSMCLSLHSSSEKMVDSSQKGKFYKVICSCVHVITAEAAANQPKKASKKVSSERAQSPEPRKKSSKRRHSLEREAPKAKEPAAKKSRVQPEKAKHRFETETELTPPSRSKSPSPVPGPSSALSIPLPLKIVSPPLRAFISESESEGEIRDDIPLLETQPPALPKDSATLDQEISELLQKSLPELNFGVLESLSFLSETPDSFCLDEALRNHQYSLLLLFYFAFSQEDRFVPETQLFSAIRGFLLSVQDQGDCPPPYVFKAVLYLLACCQDKTEALDLVSLGAIRRVLDVISDLSLVYVHHPLMLKFFLNYPELMKRFGHCILQLWFSCEDYSQIESEDAVTSGSAGFLQSYHNLNSLLSMLKGNFSALLVLLDLVCFGTGEVVHKVLITLKIFLKLNEDVHVCDLLRNQFLQILQKLLIENSSSTLPVNQTLPLSLNLLFLVQLRYVMERELDSTDFRLLHLVSNLAGKCSPTNHEILQPSLNFLYWSLQQTTFSSRQRVSILQFLRAFIRQNLCSSFVKFVVQQGKELPQSKEDASLYPLALDHVLSLGIHLQNLLVQRDLLLSQSAIGCLEVLLAYLQSKNQSIACHIASQPWNKFLLITLLDGGENSFLQPEILRLVTLVPTSTISTAVQQEPHVVINSESEGELRDEVLILTLQVSSFMQFMQYQRTSIVSHTEISHILEKAANTKLIDLSNATVSALRSFLLQIQSGKYQMDSSQTASVQILLESLPSTSQSHSTRQDMMYPLAGYLRSYCRHVSGLLFVA
ncbi:hypothetical protein JD844_028266 [Phrynosoma platyrhinos]|uniref:Meiosis inhibitor protein 1 n=1 Tax=Phrynosoma platyrhinos TaxID=52577 RepID=A0ABQ7SHQ5_PHRPL|nr:hypothetical protein JD844_028266 [Phrynosoma platyrhinos]